MKRMFYMLFLIVLITSCEDELNSPNDNPPSYPGCNDPMAWNYELLANVNNGSCIYDEQENLDYEACQEGEWSHHTCTNPADDSNASSWNGSQTTCDALNYTYTPGSCDAFSDDGGSDGESDDGGDDG